MANDIVDTAKDNFCRRVKASVDKGLDTSLERWMDARLTIMLFAVCSFEIHEFFLPRDLAIGLATQSTLVETRCCGDVLD